VMPNLAIAVLLMALVTNGSSGGEERSSSTLLSSSRHQECHIADFGGAVSCSEIVVSSSKDRQHNPSPNVGEHETHHPSPPTTSPVPQPPHPGCLLAGSGAPVSGSGVVVVGGAGNGLLCQIPTAPIVQPPQPAVGTTVTPLEIAEEYWQTVDLPRPVAAIPPGYGLCGLPAYLVTYTPQSPPLYSFATPLGRLSIKVHGVYEINWGDRTGSADQEIFTHGGQPWPVGGISHTYDLAGTYDISVTMLWSASWELAGQGGQLGGLETSSVIEGFAVRQLQSVIEN